MSSNSEVPEFFCGLAGGLGGAAGALVTNPLEVVKTRLQSSDRNMIKGDGRKKMKEGLRAFFKGLPTTLIGVIPSRFVYFYSYHWIKGVIGNNERTTHVAGAFAAGLSNIVATSPLWTIRTRQQLHHFSDSASRYTFLMSARDIYRHTGVRGFWRGASASVYGISETVIFWVLYEEYKRIYVNKKANKQHKHSHLDDLSGLGKIFLGTLCSKSLASILCYPHEVVRTRLREEKTKQKYRSFWQTLAQVRLEEGLSGWYSGMRVHILRQVPNVAIQMCVYESVIYAYRREFLL